MKRSAVAAAACRKAVAMCCVRQIQLLQSARTSSILRTQKIGVDALISSV